MTVKLAPKEDLFIETLLGRIRSGEQLWTFEARHRDTAKALEAKGVVRWKSGIVENTIMAWLTDKGRQEWLSSGYVPPYAKTLWKIYLASCYCHLDHASRCTCRAADEAAEALRELLGDDWHEIMRSK